MDAFFAARSVQGFDDMSLARLDRGDGGKDKIKTKSKQSENII